MAWAHPSKNLRPAARIRLLIAHVYQVLNDKPYESLYFYLETTIDHPVEKVWPHALNIGSWMSDHRLETIAGEAGKVGHFERVFPRKLATDVPQPHYHLYGVAEIIPRKLIVLEVFNETGGSYGKTREKTSFDAIHLTDIDGNRTQVGFLMIDMNLGKGDKNFCARRKGEMEGIVRPMIERYFENLRQLVDG
jgi:hypothetical protein